MKTRKTYKDYEAAMSRLQEITSSLESGEAKLEESIDLYTEGLEIAHFCDQKLEEAEKKIKVIMEKNGQFVEQEFGEGEDDQ